MSVGYNEGRAMARIKKRALKEFANIRPEAIRRKVAHVHIITEFIFDIIPYKFIQSDLC